MLQFENETAKNHDLLKETEPMKMPNEKIDTSMFAPCGMNCEVCYKHCCHKKPCAGCLNSDKGKPEHCRKCKIKDCIKEKALTYCFECSEYPCKLIKNLEKSYNQRYQTSLIKNSHFVQAHGLDCFMEQQKEKYTCPKCGGIISIHDGECSECKEKVKQTISCCGKVSSQEIGCEIGL